MAFQYLNASRCFLFILTLNTEKLYESHQWLHVVQTYFLTEASYDALLVYQSRELRLCFVTSERVEALTDVLAHTTDFSYANFSFLDILEYNLLYIFDFGDDISILL